MGETVFQLQFSLIFGTFRNIDAFRNYSCVLTRFYGFFPPKFCVLGPENMAEVASVESFDIGVVINGYSASLKLGFVSDPRREVRN